MNNSLRNLIMLLFAHLFVIAIYAQNQTPVVENVRFAQKTDGSYIVDVYYDVNDVEGSNMIITMKVSDDAGSTWDFSCNNISGDVGSGVTSGTNKHIVWDFGVEHPETFGDQFRIKIIADDGENGSGWVRQNVGANDALFDIEFINNTIWLCGANGVIVKSIDGGNNWNLTSLGVDRHLLSIDFIDENNGWTNDWYGVFYTTNGSASWTRQLLLNEDTLSINEIKFIDQNLGWGVGNYYAPNGQIAGKFWKTVNGGKIWSEIVPELSGALVDIHLLNAEVGMTLGGNTIFKLTNNGADWKDISNYQLNFRNLSTIYMVSQNIVYIGSEFGKIYKSIDSGETWIEQNSGTTVWLYDCYFVNENLGWFVGDKGTILHTKDGGLHWNFQQSNTNEFLLSIDFMSPTKGFIVGENGLLLKTNTQGN